MTDEMIEVASKAYAEATGYYVPFHKGLKSESSDKIRRGIRAALEAVGVDEFKAALETSVLCLSALDPEDESLYGPRALTMARAALTKAAS